MLADSTLYSLGLNLTEFWVMVAAIAVLLAVDILHDRGVQIRDSLLRQPLPVRWAAIYAALLILLIFGIYGPGYDAAAFIYFQF